MELRLTLARHFDNATKREVWTATCLVLRAKGSSTASSRPKRPITRAVGHGGFITLASSTSWAGCLTSTSATPA